MFLVGVGIGVIIGFGYEHLHAQGPARSPLKVVSEKAEAVMLRVTGVTPWQPSTGEEPSPTSWLLDDP